jgi:hypothetical protein
MINPQKGIDIINNTSIINRILFAVTIFQQLSIEEWVGSPTETFHNYFFIWKVVVLNSPLVRNWLVWKVVG